LQIEALPDGQVGGRPVDVITVSRKGFADVKVCFDKETHRLARMEHRGHEAGLTVDKEYLYGSYVATSGILLPTTYTETNDGKKFVEAKDVTYEFPAKVEERLFEKP
jgi:hypothetical protein